MITYEEALAKAREWKEDIDNCIEYDNAYVFGCTEDDNYIGGYGHTPVVIMKEDGSRTDIPMYVANGGGKEIGTKVVINNELGDRWENSIIRNAIIQTGDEEVLRIFDEEQEEMNNRAKEEVEEMKRKGEILNDDQIPQITYVEPSDYIPEELRKKHKAGEYAEDSDKYNI